MSTGPQQTHLLGIYCKHRNVISKLLNLANYKESSPLLSVGDASTSVANKEVAKVDAQHHKKRGTYHHYDDEIRAKVLVYI